MLRHPVLPVTISGQHGRIWASGNGAPGGAGGLVAVLQLPGSKLSETVRRQSFTAVAMDSRADTLATVCTRGQVYVFNIRQNRFARLDQAGSRGTAALIAGPRSIFVAFADSSIRCYDVSKGIVVGHLREHRSPVQHMEVNYQLGELLSTSIDGVLVWDLKRLRRKRVLGSGPYGALQASYTSDGQAVVTQFKDGSFYIWAAGNFALVRSFTLPVAPPLRPLQSAFCLSPDGQLLVSCGTSLPLLLVYSPISGGLLYGIGLPSPPSPLDSAVAAGVKPAGSNPALPGTGSAAEALATAATADAAEAAIGGAKLGPAGDVSAAAAALAASLPMAVGVQQARFLPDSATVAALLTDGSVAFIDVLRCVAVGAVPYQFPNRRDCTFALDERSDHMALITNGKVHLHVVADARTSIRPPKPLPRIAAGQLEGLAAAVAMEHLRRQQERGLEEHKSTQAVDEAADGDVPGTDTRQVSDKRPTVGGAAMPSASSAGAGSGAAGSVSVSAMASVKGSPAKRGKVGSQAGRQGPAVAAAAGVAGAAIGPRAPGAGRVAPGKAIGPDAAAVSLNRARLQSLLEAFGEYPAKYRLMIWEFLLQLPHNASAFATLASMGLHSAFREVQERLPLANRALAQRLAATLSQLAHWCPVFAESTFLPDLVFPFVKLFASSPGGRTAASGVTSSSVAMDERCFETLATLLSCGWLRGWWERFPHPPLGLLTRIQDVITLHDAPLASHLGTFRGGFAGVVWPHLATLWTELLPRSDWLRLWDHCITAGPDLLYFFVAAYFIVLRSQLLALDTDHSLANWVAGPPAVDAGKVLHTAYQLRSRTPEDLRPVPSEWQPLPKGATYTEFKDFPKGAVELFAADRARIRDAEEALMRRRAVASELELRTRAVSLQAASLSTERQQLAALEEQRRAMLRQIETQTAIEMARLDDRAKEEKLRQIAVVERAYQENLLEIRATWQRELEAARAEVAHKRALAAQQIRSREEDEQIKNLEFHAQQRMRAMEEDVRRAAVGSAVRDELLAQQIEAEAKQRAKMKEWEAEDEARKLRLQAETARRAEVALAAEEGAARSAAIREAQALTLTVEDEILKVDNERRLRRMAEDAALATAEARATEERRAAVRGAAEAEALRLRAKADSAWLEAEQLRREQLLEAERQQMEAAAAAAREKLAETEAATRAVAAQAELLDRRRQLERQNAAEEAETRRLVGAMAAERGRDAALVSALEAKQEEMKLKLEAAARAGSLQRRVESTEAAAAAALLADLEGQQRQELAELRRQHAAALEALAKEQEGQAAEAAERRRAELREQQLSALKAQQEAFARRKQELIKELLPQHEGRPERDVAPHQEGPGSRRPTGAGAEPEPQPRSSLPSQVGQRSKSATTSRETSHISVASAGTVGATSRAAPPPPPLPVRRASEVVTPTRSSDAYSDSNLTPSSFLTTSTATTPSTVPGPPRVPKAPLIPAPAAAPSAPPPPAAQAAPMAPTVPRTNAGAATCNLAQAVAVLDRLTAAADLEAQLRTQVQSRTLQPPSNTVPAREGASQPRPQPVVEAHSGTTSSGASGNATTSDMLSSLGLLPMPRAPGTVAAASLSQAATSTSTGLSSDPEARGGPRGAAPAGSRPGGPNLLGSSGWSLAAELPSLRDMSPLPPPSPSDFTVQSVTSVSGVSPSTLASSMRLPGRGQLFRSADAAATAASAVGRAAIAAARAVSPARNAWGQPSPSLSDMDPGSVDGSSTVPKSQLRALLGLGQDTQDLSYASSDLQSSLDTSARLGPAGLSGYSSPAWSSPGPSRRPGEVAAAGWPVPAAAPPPLGLEARWERPLADPVARAATESRSAVEADSASRTASTEHVPSSVSQRRDWSTVDELALSSEPYSDTRSSLQRSGLLGLPRAAAVPPPHFEFAAPPRLGHRAPEQREPSSSPFSSSSYTTATSATTSVVHPGTAAPRAPYMSFTSAVRSQQAAPAPQPPRASYPRDAGYNQESRTPSSLTAPSTVMGTSAIPPSATASSSLPPPSPSEPTTASSYPRGHGHATLPIRGVSGMPPPPGSSEGLYEASAGNISAAAALGGTAPVRLTADAVSDTSFPQVRRLPQSGMSHGTESSRPPSYFGSSGTGSLATPGVTSGESGRPSGPSSQGPLGPGAGTGTYEGDRQRASNGDSRGLNQQPSASSGSHLTRPGSQRPFQHDDAYSSGSSRLLAHPGSSGTSSGQTPGGVSDGSSWPGSSGPPGPRGGGSGAALAIGADQRSMTSVTSSTLSSYSSGRATSGERRRASGLETEGRVSGGGSAAGSAPAASAGPAQAAGVSGSGSGSSYSTPPLPSTSTPSTVTTALSFETSDTAGSSAQGQAARQLRSVLPGEALHGGELGGGVGDAPVGDDVAVGTPGVSELREGRLAAADGARPALTPGGFSTAATVAGTPSRDVAELLRMLHLTSSGSDDEAEQNLARQSRGPEAQQEQKQREERQPQGLDEELQLEPRRGEDYGQAAASKVQELSELSRLYHHVPASDAEPAVRAQAPSALPVGFGSHLESSAGSMRGSTLDGSERGTRRTSGGSHEMGTTLLRGAGPAAKAAVGHVPAAAPLLAGGPSQAAGVGGTAAAPSGSGHPEEVHFDGGGAGAQSGSRSSDWLLSSPASSSVMASNGGLTPGGASGVSAALHRLGLHWDAAGSMTPTTVTDLDLYEDQDDPLLMIATVTTQSTTPGAETPGGGAQ